MTGQVQTARLLLKQFNSSYKSIKRHIRIMKLLKTINPSTKFLSGYSNLLIGIVKISIVSLLESTGESYIIYLTIIVNWVSALIHYPVNIRGLEPNLS